MVSADDHPSIPQAVPAVSVPGFDYTDLNKGTKIGSGGEANVYEATLTVEDNTYQLAVKEPRVDGTIQTEVFKRFEEEAQTWAGLDEHQNIISVHGFGTDSIPWIALEYMDGGPLGNKSDNIDLEEGLWLAGRIAEGIRYGHRHGIAHLDLKPNNILLRETPDGKWSYPKVGDWGLAKLLLEHSKSVEALSPRYAAPEQFDTEEFGRPDDITDIYQFGAIIYELLTGQPPFTGSVTDVMQSVLNKTPTKPSNINENIPTELDTLVLKALSKSKSNRYESVLLMRRELDQLFYQHATGKDIEVDIQHIESQRESGNQKNIDKNQTENKNRTAQERKLLSSVVTRRRTLGAVGASAGTIGLWQYFSSGAENSSDQNPNVIETTGNSDNQAEINSDLPDFSELSNWPMVNRDETNSGCNPDFQDPELNDNTLSKRWEYEAGGRLTAPVIFDNYICVGSRDFKIHAVSAGRGDEHWTFQMPSIVTNPVAIQSGVAIAAPDDDYLVGFNLSRGRKNKSFVRKGSPPVVEDGKVYFTSFDEGGGTYCSSLDGAELIWRVDTNPYTQRPPAVGEQSVFVSGQDGEVYSIDKSGGNVIWQVDTQEETEPVQLEPPVVSGSTVFVGHSGMGEGKLYAFDSEDGSELWKHTVTSDLSEDQQPPLAVRSYVCNDNSVFFAAKLEISKVDKDSGVFQWTTSFDGVVNDLALSENWLYATDFSDSIYRINLENGQKTQIVEESSTSPRPFTSISLANNQLFASKGKYIISYGNL